MAKSPDVVLRKRPNDQAAEVPLSLTGLWLRVEGAEGAWLNVESGWMRETDVVREESVVDYFSSRLAASESAFAYLGRARGWQNQNDFGKAQADANDALRLNPHSSRAYFVRAGIAADQGRNEEEFADINRAVQLDPRDPPALAHRALLSVHRGEGLRLDSASASEVFSVLRKKAERDKAPRIRLSRKPKAAVAVRNAENDAE